MNPILWQAQGEGAIHIAPTFIQPLNVGVLAVNLDKLAVEIGQGDPGGQRLPRRVIDGPRLEPRCTGGELSEEAEHRPNSDPE